MSIRTPLCDLLGIDVPILSVGFASSATPELAAAVSNAGGLGVLGLGLPLDVLRDRVARTRALTARPFGGNFILAAFADPETPEKYREARRSQPRRTSGSRCSFFSGAIPRPSLRPPIALA